MIAESSPAFSRHIAGREAAFKPRRTRQKETAGTGPTVKGKFSGIELSASAKVVRFGEKTPGGWGAENYRSLRRTGPSEATIERLMVYRGRGRAEKGQKQGISRALDVSYMSPK